MQPPDNEVLPSEADAPPASAAEAIPNLARHGEALAWLAEQSRPRFGGFWRRAGASVLDALIFSLIGLPASILTLTAYGSAASTIVSLVSGLLGIAVIPYCWARWARTPGKALMGLRIVRLEDLGPISGWRAVGRFAAQLLAWLPLGLGILWVAWDKRKRGWHDRLADTLVVRVPSLQESRDPRRKWAIGAVWVGVVAYGFSIFVGISIAVTMFSTGFRDTSGALAFRQSIGLYALRTGDCMDLGDPIGLAFSTVEATPCRLDHADEVFGTPRLPGNAFPSGEMESLAYEYCLGRFEEYVGTPYDESTYYFWYVSPDETTWLSGTRTVICYLFNENETQVRGSVRGSGD